MAEYGYRIERKQGIVFFRWSVVITGPGRIVRNRTLTRGGALRWVVRQAKKQQRGSEG